MNQDSDEITPHEETREFRYFGPPGTGKTTTLTRQIKRAAAKFGAKSVLVTSFSKAAAAELVSRDLPCPKENTGTLHSICWHALGAPKIAEAHVEEWNKRWPQRALSRHNGSPEDCVSEERTSAHQGDELFKLIGFWRGLKIPLQVWRTDARDFFAAWTDYKQQNGLMDFNDLLETARDNFRAAPGRPNVIFADEVQDLNPLQFDLIRHWGKQTDYFVTSGDDDQLIFGFVGCTAKSMLEPALPDYAVRVLDQSFRCPAAVHTIAQKWIAKVKERQPKQWKPREAEGVVARIPHSLLWPKKLVGEIIVPEVQAGRSVMVLASCSYMLSGLIGALREAAIPFHNPYRRNNGLWNPISPARGGAAARVLSLLSVHPSWPDARRWRRKDLALVTEWMAQSSHLIRGAKTDLKKGEEGQPVTAHDLAQTFLPGTLDELINCLNATSPGLLADWWQKSLAASYQKRAGYPLAVALRHGREALTDEPAVIIGTIHSVKGGQADTVIVFPDLSAQGHMDQTREPDAMTRLFYVAITRARQRLYLGHPGHGGSRSSIWTMTNSQLVQ